MDVKEEEQILRPRHVRPSAEDGVTSLYEWVEAAVFSLIVVVLVFAFIFRIVGVEGTSMMTTLKDSDRLILTHLLYEPERGDIVVINRYSKEPLVKRIIGLEGDTIAINQDGEVLLNGEVLDEPYLAEGTVTWRNQMGDEAVTVPAGCVFVMGDNRGPGRSHDSRSNEAGLRFVDKRDLMGKAVYRIWPFESFGDLYTYQE